MYVFVHRFVTLFELTPTPPPTPNHTLPTTPIHTTLPLPHHTLPTPPIHTTGGGGELCVWVVLGVCDGGGGELCAWVLLGMCDGGGVVCMGDVGIV